MPERVLVLDIGSSVAKAHVFSRSGALLGQSTAKHRTHAPEAGAAVQHADEWWEAWCSLVPPLVARWGVPEAIGVTGQMHGFIAISSDGETLCPYYTLHDRRGIAQIARMEAIVPAEEIYRVTGARLSAAAPAAKLRWLREAHPDLFDRASAFLSAKDFVRWQLTRELATDPLDAAGMVLYDLERARWSDDLLAAWDLPLEKLPPILHPTARAGTLQPAAAHALGLPAGIPVVVGSGDDIEYLGAGVMRPGQGLEHLGTTGSVLVCQDQLVFDPERRLEIGPHITSGLWLVGGSTSAAGMALRWMAGLLGVAELPLPDCDGSPVERRPMLVPHLSGERAPLWNANVQGALVGLDMTHGRSSVARAAFEGVTMSLRDILEALRAIGALPEELVVTDHESAAWSAMRADAYGLPLHIPRHSDATALGSLIVTGVGVGMYPDVSSAVEELVKIERTVLPEVQRRSEYDRLYARYRVASRAAQDLEAACA